MQGILMKKVIVSTKARNKPIIFLIFLKSKNHNEHGRFCCIEMAQHYSKRFLENCRLWFQNVVVYYLTILLKIVVASIIWSPSPQDLTIDAQCLSILDWNSRSFADAGLEPQTAKIPFDMTGAKWYWKKMECKVSIQNIKSKISELYSYWRIFSERQKTPKLRRENKERCMTLREMAT